MRKIFCIIVIIILLPIVFVNGVILANSITKPNEIPSFFGWKPFIVLSGSMETQVFPGDLVIVKEVEANNLKVNDIIAFKSGDIVITHRIVEIVNENGENKYATKGDNNNTKDIGYVSQEDIEGLYQFKISKLGNLAMFIQTPIGMIACLSIPLLLLLILRMREKDAEQEEMVRELEKLRKQNNELQDKEKITK